MSETMYELWAQVVEKVGPERAWRPGMRERRGLLRCFTGWLFGDDEWAPSEVYEPHLPDFDDDATRGALLGLAIEFAEEHHIAGRFIESEDMRTDLRTAIALWVGGASVASSEAILRAILAAP